LSNEAESFPARKIINEARNNLRLKFFWPLKHQSDLRIRNLIVYSEIVRGEVRPLPTTCGYLQWLDLKTYLSTVTKRINEDKTLFLHITQPLQIAFVGSSRAFSSVHS
jgi:hypothetical protein